MRSSFFILPLLLLSSCDVREPYAAPIIHVSPDGDDANDGLRLPVRTLKRGIGLAAANPVITTILVEAGRYDAASGETFPYSVPENVTISGPAGGGVILAGTGAEPGLTIGAGELRDLEFEGFTVAVTSTGMAQLANLRVRSSETAIRSEAASRLMVTNVDVSDMASTCTALGFELNGDAEFTAREVSTRHLGTAFQIKDQTTVSISKANVTGIRTCGRPAFEVSTTRTFVLDESVVDGSGNGIRFEGAATPTIATLTNTALRNMGRHALVGSTVTLTMTGGELSRNSGLGLQGIGGAWTLNNVTISQNGEMAIYAQGRGAASPTTLAMHGCTISNNSRGVYLFDDVIADFGTIANPGNNAFLANTGVGLDIDHYTGATVLITAVGNTWRPNVQGADAEGKYRIVGNVSGPVEPGPGGNFAINAGGILQR